MDDHESNREPDAPIRFEVTRRTVVETGATALLLTALPRAAVAAGSVDDKEPPPPSVSVTLQINGRSHSLPLDRGDEVAVVHDRERQAGVDAASFDQHRARAALAVIATFFRAGQGEVLPQSIEQRRAGIEGQRMRTAVDLKCDAH